MKQNPLSCLAIFCLAALPMSGLSAATHELPAKDTRAAKTNDLNTPRTFPHIASKSEWQARAREIREQILVSCGLWPLPEKTPLNARIFGRVERDGYSIEKVYFQTYPGFYLSGNLYRPLGKGDGPFPAILNPHGHWANGRMADTKDGSIAARCINFAKQGMIAFSYDMVGYNDTIQVNHKFASNLTNQLWNISLMGLQTWDSIRALDFLESLPDADKTRLACTGESGGGTQTFMLGAVDDRLAVQAPIVMVSHTMQGGCLCENAPGLRVDHSNMEIAAVPAPRPQILVAATGDWTKTTMTVEGPAIESIYRLFKSPHQLRYVRYDFGHNYNQTSREAVYTWFNQRLLHPNEPRAVQEVAYKKEPDQDLRVWPDGKLPADALNESQLIDLLIKLHRSQWQALKPTDKKSLASFQKVMSPAWRRALQVEVPDGRSLAVETGKAVQHGGFTITPVAFGRDGKGDRIPAVLCVPRKAGKSGVVVLANPAGKSTCLNTNGAPIGLAKELLERGFTVLLPDVFLTGELADPELGKSRKYSEKYFTTYNRTDAQERVQDLITACVFARTHTHNRRVILCGAGRAGLWALLAAPAADAVVADCDALNVSSDEALLAQDLFFPGIRNLGAFEGAAMLAAPHPLLLHNTGKHFASDSLLAAYSAAGATDSFGEEPRQWSDSELTTHITQLKLK
ncbi:MAG: acetylxylan esterase [Verrucomicrobia bacterium]|nr:acetylxylan esterase [Verrucomicrobiota bacterium]